MLQFCFAQVLIENGELMTGIICKKTVGAAGNGLNHIIMVEEGPEIAKEFYGDLQKVVNNWLLVEGHSIGRYLVKSMFQVNALTLK